MAVAITEKVVLPVQNAGTPWGIRDEGIVIETAVGSLAGPEGQTWELRPVQAQLPPRDLTLHGLPGSPPQNDAQSASPEADAVAAAGPGRADVRRSGPW